MNVLSEAKRAVLTAAFEAGHTVREAAALAGVSKGTALTYSRRVARGPCACGQPSGHKGWCCPRFEASFERMASMRAVHRRQYPKPVDGILKDCRDQARGKHRTLGEIDECLAEVMTALVCVYAAVILIPDEAPRWAKAMGIPGWLLRWTLGAGEKAGILVRVDAGLAVHPEHRKNWDNGHGFVAVMIDAMVLAGYARRTLGPDGVPLYFGVETRAESS